MRLWEIMKLILLTRNNSYDNYIGNQNCGDVLFFSDSNCICSFAPPEITDEEFNTAWLYDVAARQWARWLPAEVSSTIRYGGYYTAVILPGLRVISLNTNYCYTSNWWTLSKSQDPASSLLWLNKVLEDAERAGEKVILFSYC